MNRILIIQTAFLGDVILATPVVAELKRIFPNASIDMLVKKGNESLIQNNPHLHTIYTLDKRNGKFKEIRSLIKVFRGLKFDLIINLHRFASSGIIAGLSNASSVYGFKKNPLSFLYSKKFDHKIGDGTHEVERNLSLIAEFGARSIVRPELFPSERDIAVVNDIANAPYVCMAPASVWFTKQLPKEKWIELLNQFADKKVYLVGGPDDKNLCDEIIEGCSSIQAENLAGKLNLLQSAVLFKNAERVYVNDSGPLHIASAMNAPTTAFFCSTIPSFGFGPLAESSEIREVSNLECRPCGLHGYKSCPKQHFDCGRKMDVSL